jgi:hypothetical protein
MMGLAVSSSEVRSPDFNVVFLLELIRAAVSSSVRSGVIVASIW